MVCVLPVHGHGMLRPARAAPVLEGAGPALGDEVRMRAAAIVPARNEALTVGGVVEAAVRSQTVDQVLVVDNGSTDDTAAVARRHGASVVSCDQKGKGQAMRAGVAATAAEVIVFLDADLVGLVPEHVQRLVEPLLDERAELTLGLFDRGEEANQLFLHMLPKLTGQRAMRRELFESLTDDDIRGYKVEAALNARAKELGLRIDTFVCYGLWHRTKEEKDRYGPMVGTVRKVAMLTTAVWSYLAYRAKRPWRRPEGTPR